LGPLLSAICATTRLADSPLLFQFFSILSVWVRWCHFDWSQATVQADTIWCTLDVVGGLTCCTWQKFWHVLLYYVFVSPSGFSAMSLPAGIGMLVLFHQRPVPGKEVRLVTPGYMLAS
jgi:hypothetical protein